MDISNYLNEVSIDNIYQTILDLEGPKHPIDNYEKMEEAVIYLEEKLQSYGIETEIQEFYIEGFEQPFKNVIGYIGDRNEKAVVLGSHYDTVVDTPGANDNLSAVAISLEIGRVLTSLEQPPSVIIAIFTLEEGHPSRIKWRNEVFREKGWFDELNRFTSYELLSAQRKVYKLFNQKRQGNSKRLAEIYQDILDDHTIELKKIEQEYIEVDLKVVKKIEQCFKDKNNIFYGLIGSTEFVRKILAEKIEIKYLINFDTIGWISNKEGSQKRLPIPKEMSSLYSCYKMDIDETIGNFVTVIGNKPSKQLLDQFLTECKEPNIEAPHFGLYLPFSMEEIRNNVPDTLRSDHTPFWNEDIPGIFITDGGNFRSPYYHTKEDTYEKIDYTMLKKVTIASIRCILSNI